MDQFTIDNQGITELNQLLFLTILQTGLINQTLDLMTGVEPGSRLGGIGEMESVGRPANGCKPNWRASKIDTQEKMWELGAYEVAETICYQDLEDTIVRWSMRLGTDRADFTGGDYMNLIVEPKLREALDKMIWRMLWFGNKAALNVSDDGDITDDVDTDLFTVCDGLFKRIFDITIANPAQRVTIAANAATTYEAQQSGILVAGVAKQIFDDLYYKIAPKKLRQKSDRVLLMTQSLADALTIDIKRNTGSELQWKSILEGLGNESSLMTTTIYNGQTILALPIWDDMIKSYQDTGSSLILPHRAVFASKSDLKAGVHSNDMIAQLKIWFSDDDQDNKMLVRDKLGTLTWEDNLIVAAY